MMMERRGLGIARGAQRAPTVVGRASRNVRLMVRAQAPFMETATTTTTEAATPSSKPAPVAASPQAGYANSLVLQGFAWDSWEKGGGNWYAKVAEAIPLINELGATHVWLPPVSDSVSNEGYMPGELYCLSSKYGNENDIVALNRALKEAGITPMADIVINHRCAGAQRHGVWNQFTDNEDHKGRSIDWGRWAITGNDPHFHGIGNPDTGEDFAGAPDLDHTNPELRAALKDWLSWLHKDIGFDAFRFDYVKGYAPEFIEGYVDAATGINALNIGELWTDMQWGDGGLEYNQDAARQRSCDWINGTKKRSTAFDFVTKAQLQEACRNTQYDRLRDGNGKASGLLGWWPSMAVTFIENHDTGSTQQHWPFPSEFVGTGYAYILTHPGIPCVFWDHLMTWGDELRDSILGLAALRRRAGIVSDTPLTILAADHDFYVARIGENVTLKMGPRCDMGDLLPKESEGWKVALNGKDWAVWERVSS